MEEEKPMPPHGDNFIRCDCCGQIIIRDAQSREVSFLRSHFRVNEVLDEGAFGSISRCEHVLLSKNYAVMKVTISQHHYTYYTSLAEELRKMHHPNVIRYNQAWMELGPIGSPPDLYIQMEYFPRDLTALLDSSALLNPDSVFSQMLELVDAIRYIHGQGFYHRQIAPRNIFLDDNDHVKVGNFGFGMDYGLEPYKAPEARARKFSYKSDIYSLGVVFLEMLLHIEKAKVDIAEAVFQFRKKKKNEFTSYVGKEDLIRKMLSSDPGKRPTAEDLYDLFNKKEEETDDK